LEKIRWIVFDFGGVISKKQNTDIIKKMSLLLSIPVNEFPSLYTRQRKEYDSGIIDAYAYWVRTVKLAGKIVGESDIKKLIEYDIKSWLDINEEMIEYIQSIRDKVNLALLSNMTFDTLKEICNKYWFDFFKIKILSFEKRVVKPDLKIYDICLKELNIEANQVLFIDDSEENVKTAQQMGMNVIKFNDCKSMKNIIENEYILSK
jgi:putative hydrolase of the HAD superfamily